MLNQALKISMKQICLSLSDIVALLRRYVTDNNSSFDGLEIIYDEVNQRANLNCMEEEADSRLNFYVANARVEGFKKVLVLPNDSDVVT